MFIETLERRILCSSAPQGLTPAQVRTAYSFDQIILPSGAPADGAGQKIAVIDPYDLPNLPQTIKTFDNAFGLPTTDSKGKQLVTKATPFGKPRVDSNWALESALDVEWAHAVAPKAQIILVEAKSNSLGDLLRAVNYARNIKGVSVISMSWGSSEFVSEVKYNSYFITPKNHIGGGGKRGGITFVAASGDTGGQTSWPAVAPTVLAVGGTTLNVDSNGNYISESTWDGSGGGIATYGPKHQTPDVSYNADPSTGVSVYSTVPYQGQSGWFVIGGTSAGAPQWAGLVALADQARAQLGKPSLTSDQTIQTIHSMPSSNFHDITSGSNGYDAQPGYDLATGEGSPIADRVVDDLLHA